MEARILVSTEQLRPGYRNIPEPDVSACPKEPPENIDLALIPCVSCTGQGVRLGQGGGFYDRFLPLLKGTRIVLCREKMLSDTLPQELWDVPVPWLLTEEKMYSAFTGAVPAGRI